MNREGRGVLIQCRPLAKEKSSWSLPCLAALADPLLQRLSRNRVNASVRDDFENGRDRGNRELAQGLVFRVSDIELGGIVCARGQDIEAVPAALAVSYADRAPRLRHGAGLSLRRR